jgi:hypothetical protein
MYFPHAGRALTPAATLYANKCIPSIYSSHIHRLVECFTQSVFKVSPDEIRLARPGPRRVTFARQVAMYLTHVGAGLPQAEVGRLLARDRTTVAHACAVVEERRDDPVFDRSLEVLETVLSHARADGMTGEGGWR